MIPPRPNWTPTIAVVATVGLTAERVNNGIIKRQQLLHETNKEINNFAYRNNQLALKREIENNKRRADERDFRIRQAQERRQIQTAYFEKKISKKERDECLEILSDNFNIKSNNLLKNKASKTDDSSKFASITFGNTIKGAPAKKYIAEIPESEFYFIPKFEKIGDYPFFFLIFTSLLIGIPLGLVIHELIIFLYTWFVFWIRNITSKK